MKNVLVWIIMLLALGWVFSEVALVTSWAQALPLAAGTGGGGVAADATIVNPPDVWMGPGTPEELPPIYCRRITR